jgi:hypothetical protein
MSPKRKTKQAPANISITGDVKGVGNVVGNESQSNVSISTSAQKSAANHKSNVIVLWSRLVAFLLGLVGILAATGVFVRLLEGFDALLVVQLVLAGLIAALGISGFLKPILLVDLFGKLFGKK